MLHAAILFLVKLPLSFTIYHITNVSWWDKLTKLSRSTKDRKIGCRPVSFATYIKFYHFLVVGINFKSVLMYEQDILITWGTEIHDQRWLNLHKKMLWPN